MTPDLEVGAGHELAEFLADWRTWLTADHRTRAAWFLLDTLAVTAFGSRQPWARAAARHAQTRGRPGPAVLVGTVTTTSPAMAAFANGVAAHAFELDDVHEEAISHPGAVVVPAALAAAAHLGDQGVAVAGADLLAAVVVGYEAMGRIGLAVDPPAHMRAGFHPTGQSGVFGAAAAAGVLLDFDVDGFSNAFGLATSFTSGTTEFSQSGGMGKRFHAGRAAEGGLTAALLVSDGVEGAGAGLDGRYGFCRVFSPSPDVAALVRGLGERWMVDEVTVKPWAACSDIHPLIEAALHLRGDGLDTADIETITAFVPSKAAEQNALDGTTSVMAAQYSGPFNVAAALLADPANPATYDQATIGDPKLAALQARVRLVPDDDFDDVYARTICGRLEVRLRGGQVVEHTIRGQWGSMHHPLRPDEVVTKARRVAGDILDVPALHAAIADLGTTPAADLFAALATGSRRTDLDRPEP